MFQGHTIVTLDEKGRMIIPSKFRKHIQAEANNLMLITRGRNDCLWMYPSNHWNKLTNSFIKLNRYKKDVIDMERQLLYYVEECTIDNQHRILIPQHLLKLVSINKEVLLLGQLDRIEIWNQKVYLKYLKSNKKSYEQIMEKVMSNFVPD